MPTKPGTGEERAPTVDEQFLALVYADEDLLRAEFDAIITAEWPSPPPTTPGRGFVDGRPPSGATRPPADQAGGSVAGPEPAGTGGRSRQRSPPPAEPRFTMRKAGDRHP